MAFDAICVSDYSPREEVQIIRLTKGLGCNTIKNTRIPQINILMVKISKCSKGFYICSEASDLLCTTVSVPGSEVMFPMNQTSRHIYQAFNKYFSSLVSLSETIFLYLNSFVYSFVLVV